MHACAPDPAGHAVCQEAKGGGVEPQRIARAARRKRPKPRIQCECQTVQAAIRGNEDAEQHVGARGVMESLAPDTLSLRKRYRELGC